MLIIKHEKFKNVDNISWPFSKSKAKTYIMKHIKATSNDMLNVLNTDSFIFFS